MTQLDKTYDPNLLESKWYSFWEEQDLFKPSGTGKPFCIVIPPPNITGVLHMGHAFQDTIMDALTRYQRMRGANTLWQMGTDHAGIATQMVVERQLASQNQSKQALGRQKFVDKIWQWREESGSGIRNQIKRLGASVDWKSERFTLDPGLSDAVQRCFIELFDEGLIYRGKKLVNWDPVLKTAVSDLEVIPTEEQGKMWHIRYPLTNSSASIIVATTRPETMLGDTAVAVNPEDPRYMHLIGKTIELPITNRVIPIVGDSAIDQEFGTGCVKITPAHDFNDYEIGQRHNLELLQIFDNAACITTNSNANIPEKYNQLDRSAARTLVLEDLQALDLLVKTEDHTNLVPRGDRSNAILEPHLTDQWFVKMAPLAEPALEAVRSKKIQFVPENWENTYFDWLNNIKDWCISRQIWWGHRIPAWYDPDGHVYVASSAAQVRKKYQLSDNHPLTQDEDVLDTWFSSALWPFSSLGWPDHTEYFKQFYPTSVLVTGFDIIFYWVARMIMFGLKFTGQVPFREVYIHGLILDPAGQKMSKTKGNVLDPIDLIQGIALEKLVEKRTQNLMQPQMAESIAQATRKDYPEGIPAYGTDALRFTFCALATTGRQIRFDLKRTEGYRNFCNKLWNAARYVFMQIEQQSNKNIQPIPQDANSELLSTADKWIFTVLQATKKSIEQHFVTYRFDLIAQELYEFVWHDFCDWYLELAKPVLNSDNNPQQNSATLWTLTNVLDQILCLLHPIMPFITEEIWQQLPKRDDAKTIMLQKYPEYDAAWDNNEALGSIQWLQQVVIAIRTLRSERDVPPGKTLEIFLCNGTEQDKEYLQDLKLWLTVLAKISAVTWLESVDTSPSACATLLIGDMQVLIPLQGLIDKASESERLTREIGKSRLELDKITERLNNASYRAKAPAAVVAENEQKQVALSKAIVELEEKYRAIQEL